MIAYLDCFSGISGDMFLGALIDAGVPPEELVKGLPFSVEIKVKKIQRSGIKATAIELSFDNKKIHSLKDFRTLILQSENSEDIRLKALKIIENLFEAEARIHGIKPEDVHLHELGSLDTIIDILGSLRGLKILGIKKLYASQVNTGRGFIKSAHGILPVPAPATLELLKGFTLISSGPEAELITPTGASLLKGLAIPSQMPSIKLSKIGYGAGSRDLGDWPNVLRLIIGEPEDSNTESFFIIETNIDDMNPQFYEYLIDLLLEKGALDVYIENIIMKKSRPAQKLSVLCKEEYLKPLSQIIFKETTTLGMRYYRVGRLNLPRRIENFSSSLGNVRIKIAEWDDTKRIMPEYEDIKNIAKEKGLSIQEVMERVKREIPNT